VRAGQCRQLAAQTIYHELTHRAGQARPLLQFQVQHQHYVVQRAKVN
jgi:hypothetical protein